MAGFQRPRLVVQKVTAQMQTAGRGAVVRRSIGSSEADYLDPFLLLDEFSVSPPAGFPEHPHRGFETVTYMFRGGLAHQDFTGHEGKIEAGDVQWMTAGRGVVHAEMPIGEGTHTGLQLWVNLSSHDKMVEPHYHEVRKEQVPEAEEGGVEVKVIAGEAMGIHSPYHSRIPIMYLHFTLKPNTEYHQRVPELWNAFVYVIEGEGVFGSPDSAPSEKHHALVLGPGEGLSAWNKSKLEKLRFILVGGQPLNEPVVKHWPFVMNCQDEIDAAFEDYNNGRNGFEFAKQWSSTAAKHVV